MPQRPRHVPSTRASRRSTGSHAAVGPARSESHCASTAAVGPRTALEERRRWSWSAAPGARRTCCGRRAGPDARPRRPLGVARRSPTAAPCRAGTSRRWAGQGQTAAWLDCCRRLAGVPRRPRCAGYARTARHLGSGQRGRSAPARRIADLHRRSVSQPRSDPDLRPHP